MLWYISGFAQWLSAKVSACSAGDMDLIPGLRRCSEEGNGNPLQYSCLKNSMNKGTWWTIVHGVTKELDTTLGLKQKMMYN